MQTTYFPTHRLRFSQPAPPLPGWPETEDWDPGHALLSYISVPPAQFYDPPTNLAHGRPEAELMRAVLKDALLCFQKGLVHPGRRVQRLAREAEEWLFSDDDSWPCSFVSICAVLGLEPEYLRRGLRSWRHGRPPTAATERPRVVAGQRRLAA
jgi:hypothetical protein